MMMDMSGLRPTATWDVLRARAQLLRIVRRFFDERGYCEVETPLLSADVCVDVWLDPFIVPDAGGPDERQGRMFLQTSPEFGMKRLLSAGADAIYQITRSFRRGEAGRRHNPEFTIVEWYRVGDTLEQQIDLVEELVRAVAEVTEASDLDSALVEPRTVSFRRIAYDAAFEEFAGRRVLDASTAELRRLAERHGIAAPDSLASDDRDGWLNLLLAEVVEPALAGQGGVILYDYPASQAALARVRDQQPPLAERFELYLDGVEICNGYRELTDPDHLAARMQAQAAKRREAGLSELPVDSRLIEAMRSGLPECSGVALGFDRLVMWRLGLERIADVIPFPWDRA
jgi:lysyl-tRNA synthetase class 2